jgi:hypothetical protein
MLTSAYDQRQSQNRKEPSQQELFNEAVGPALRRCVEAMREAYLWGGKTHELAPMLETMLGDDFAMPDLEADAIGYTADAWVVIEVYKFALGAFNTHYRKGEAA